MGGRREQPKVARSPFNQCSSSTWETIKLTQIIKVAAAVFDMNDKTL